MNKIQVFENDNSYIEFSADTAEILLCKQLLNPINADYIPFILNNFNVDWLKNDERKDLYKISQKFYDARGILPNEATMRQIFKNKKFEDKEALLTKEYNEIINFDEKSLDDKLVVNAIKEYIKAKSIYFAILNNISSIESTGELGNLVSQFEKIIQLDLTDDLGIEYFENLDNHIIDLKKKNDKVPFGFSDLDKYTYGGLPVNDTCLFVIMAQPGLGKSQFMSNIAYNWVLKNKKTLILSLEMSENMYSKRFDALFTDISQNQIKDHTDTLRAVVKGVKANLPKALLQIKEFPTGTLTCAMLKQYLKKLKQQKNFEPDIIFVDYLNIMRPNGSNAGSLSLYEKSGRIAEELRAISSELKIPIVTGVQANRSGSTGGYAGENIDMSNVSESAGISATADALVALYQLEGERENNRINVKILKNRLGGYVGVSFPLYSDYPGSLRMSDWNKDTSINDDVLGSVTDGSSVVENGKIQNQSQNNDDEKSLIEEI